MTFSSLSLYDTHGLPPHINVLFWGSSDFPIRYSNRTTSWIAWNRHSGRLMVNTGILLSNMKSPSHECYSDFQTSHKIHDLYTELDIYRITNGFHGAFATGLARFLKIPVLGLAYICSNCWDQCPRTCSCFCVCSQCSHPSVLCLLVAFCVVIFLPFFFIFCRYRNESAVSLSL